jgi:hypothetical protein
MFHYMAPGLRSIEAKVPETGLAGVLKVLFDMPYSTLKPGFER